jgi:hypothetical protein
MLGPYNPVTCKAPNPKQATPKRNKWIPNILGKSKESFHVHSSQNIYRSQYTQC